MPAEDNVESTESAITVKQFYQFGSKRLKMKLVTGAEGLGKRITSSRVQKTGLALAGFLECASQQRIQILGRTEMLYLEQQNVRSRASLLKKLLACDLACFVITATEGAPEYLRDAAEADQTPLFTSPLESDQVIDLITHFLDQQLAPRSSIHGDLLDIFGLGVLLIGDSGVGKSECALDLIARGHRLVADDVVEIKLVENEVLFGSCPKNIRYLMELRGIGLIDVKDLFGVGSVRDGKKIELVIKLESWDEEKEYSRLGFKEEAFSFFGIELPYVIMPVAPGRNLSILVEVAARNQLLKHKGVHVARRVSRRLDRQLRRSTRKTETEEIITEGAGLFE